MSFITFPFGFCPTQVPGYFWDVQTQQLYSIKSGELKPLKLSTWSGWLKWPHPKYGLKFNGYQVSYKGKRVRLWLEDLKQLKTVGYVIPVVPHA